MSSRSFRFFGDKIIPTPALSSYVDSSFHEKVN